jgi:hypothetical protein
MAFTGDDTMSGKNDDDISPYLRRPLRSLMEYLREGALRRKQQRDLENTKERPRPSDGASREDGDAPKDGA